MELLKTLLLGAIQGLTEFLPVSSSGHLVVFKHLFDMGSIPKLFDVLLHVATLLVVVFFFRERIQRILISWAHLVRRSTDDGDREQLRLTLVILIGTFFTGVMGYVIQDIAVFQTVRSVSILFIVTGMLLITTRYLPIPDDTSLKLSHGVRVGIAQGFGTLPGISRSGITITAALWGGMDRKEAGELSFLISIPAIIGAVLLEAGEGAALAGQMGMGTLALGCFTAAVSGYFSLRILMWLIQSGKLYYFSIYLIPLGIAGLVL
jgi:undecaprenyl-diphosphatase